MTYWTLNAIFLAIAAVGFAAALVTRRRRRRSGVPGSRVLGPVLLTAAVLLVVSAVFDNVMIGVGLVGYNRSLISGAFIGIAPLEDFAYAVGAAVLLPALWVLLPTRRARS